MFTLVHLLPETGARRFAATTQAGTRLFRRKAGRPHGICNHLPDTETNAGGSAGRRNATSSAVQPLLTSVAIRGHYHWSS